MDFVVEGDRSRGRPKRKLGKTVDGEFEKFEDKKENLLCEAQQEYYPQIRTI